MRLIFDGKVEQYLPAIGQILIPGEADYPDEATEQLLAAGLKKAKTKKEKE